MAESFGIFPLVTWGRSSQVVPQGDREQGLGQQGLRGARSSSKPQSSARTVTRGNSRSCGVAGGCLQCPEDRVGSGRGEEGEKFTE